MLIFDQSVNYRWELFAENQCVSVIYPYLYVAFYIRSHEIERCR